MSDDETGPRPAALSTTRASGRTSSAVAASAASVGVGAGVGYPHGKATPVTAQTA